jgi:hypothetical protein
MEVIGDQIVRILHNGGIQYDDVVVDTYVIQLQSGHCIELNEDGPAPASTKGLEPDTTFDRYIGLRIVSVETSESWPTPGLRLSNGCVLVMGSPHPYYYGLEVVESASCDL